MAFAVVCKSCQARFLLNDDLLRRKVAGRVVTVRCRQCHATIEVDASGVDPKALPEIEQSDPPILAARVAKPAPLPPRPMTAKSTLMGIGAPRPGGATELVALSPGFLSVSVPAPSGVHGFPEPPPPPGAIEELNAGDWEVTETPPLTLTDLAPESVDDFIEELPPSEASPDEELPSATGTPSLQALAHHDPPAPKPRADEFLANMSAVMNDGIVPGATGGAPTIDVSTLVAAPPESKASIDLALLDVPLPGRQTLPLFALGNDAAPLPPAPPLNRPRANSDLGEGALGPAALNHPAREAEASESVRERKNVVAPASNSVPPPAPSQRRSGLAAPVLLVLAVAAGVLIWKRSAGRADTVTQAEPPEPAKVTAPLPLATLPASSEQVVTPLASVAAAPSGKSDDVTFEMTPSKPVTTTRAAGTNDKPTGVAGPSVEKSVAAVPQPEAKPDPATPATEDEPQAPSGEPAGPFDRAAATAALTAGAVQASTCRKDGAPSGVATVVITFAPSGRVTSANIGGPPFAGTPTGSCIAAALRKARVPAFDGERVTVSKTIVVQ